MSLMAQCRAEARRYENQNDTESEARNLALLVASYAPEPERDSSLRSE